MKTYLFLLLLQISVVFMYFHRKPLPEKLWSRNCDKNSMVLNDCNWCRCQNNKYNCKARVCNEIDMFKHFNDAIDDIHVGMEGHGVWRSSHMVCEPGVEYIKDKLSCICRRDGSWPRPECSKAFQLLRTTATPEILDEENCEPDTVKMFGCIMCFCDRSGKINTTNCHDELCQEKVYNTNVGNEIYAECKAGKTYKVKSKTCKCLPNNRLECSQRKRRSLCSGSHDGEIFNVECNYCFCDSFEKMYCTSKSCLNILDEEDLKKRFDVPNETLHVVESPIDDTECTEGTQYEKDCNTCKCFRKGDMKVVSCTANRCSANDMASDCVLGTTYEKNCHHCYCILHYGVKYEVCVIDNHCKSIDISRTSLTTTHGYCQPLHKYKQGCNTCVCQSNGQIMTCTTNVCENVNVEMVPIKRNVGYCPSGHTYKLDCNICYCLSNGNVLCTMTVCNGK